ncbi:hypothetical protein ACLOJK_007781, partial [Asimina triloba]
MAAVRAKAPGQRENISVLRSADLLSQRKSTDKQGLTVNITSLSGFAKTVLVGTDATE